MPNYAVESMRQAMTGTGIVEPVMDWIETPDGKRRPGDTQSRDERTGMLLWAVEVLYISESFGRKSTVTAKVTVGQEDEPKVAPLSPIAFNGLRVEVRTNKAGGFAEYWSAEGVLEASKTANRPSAEKAA
jgi:hypothetical protein